MRVTPLPVNTSEEGDDIDNSASTTADPSHEHPQNPFLTPTAEEPRTGAPDTETARNIRRPQKLPPVINPASAQLHSSSLLPRTLTHNETVALNDSDDDETSPTTVVDIRDGNDNRNRGVIQDYSDDEPDVQSEEPTGITLNMKRWFYLIVTKGASDGLSRFPDPTRMPSEVKQNEVLAEEGSLWSAAAKGDLEGLKRIKRALGAEHMAKTGVNEVYQGQNFAGEHSCHIIAVQNKLPLLKKFVKLGADVHTPRATGLFFKPKGSLYFGETVLAFAAVMGHYDIVKWLVESVGVDPNMTDHYGNNVLHVLAHWGYYNDTRARFPERLEYKNSRHENLGGLYLYLRNAGADESLANSSGMTPLQVAVSKSHSQMVNAIINSRRETVWIYGKASCYLYDLSELDTYIDPNTMNHKNGALEIAIKMKNRDILNLPLFQRLLEAKWISYARRMFYFSFISTFLYMILFTVMIILLPNGAEYYDYGPSGNPPKSRIDYFNSSYGIVRFCVEVLVVFCNVYTFSEEVKAFVKSKGDYFTGTGAAENVTQWINMILLFAAGLSRAGSLCDAENALLGMHAVTGWLYVLTFSKGFKGIGTLVLIFTHMVTGDLFRFGLLCTVFILGFGEALWLQMRPFASYYEASNSTLVYNYDDWSQIQTAFVWSFRFLMQQGVYDDYRNARNSGLAIVLYMILFFVLLILLLNVFIAMLNQTFSTIIADTEKQWRMIWAELILFYDEVILTQYTEQVAIGIQAAMPVTRIGFPVKAVNWLSNQRRMRHLVGKLKEAKMPWWIRIFMGRKEEKSDQGIFYKYCLIFEFREDLELPTRMIASTDINSPLSGKKQEESFSSVPWDQSLLFKKDSEEAPPGPPPAPSKRGRSRTPMSPSPRRRRHSEDPQKH